MGPPPSVSPKAWQEHHQKDPKPEKMRSFQSLGCLYRRRLFHCLLSWESSCWPGLAWYSGGGILLWPQQFHERFSDWVHCDTLWYPILLAFSDIKTVCQPPDDPRFPTVQGLHIADHLFTAAWLQILVPKLWCQVTGGNFRGVPSGYLT